MAVVAGRPAGGAATMQNPGKSLSLNAFVASIEVVYQQSSGTSTDVILGNLRELS
jgi:hypothetical protein